ncbi:MAG: hypothetical protein ABUT39_28270 [Acidobacteriota bacterium]
MTRSFTVVALLALVLCGRPSFAGPVTLVSRADPARPSGTAGGAARVAGMSSDGRYTLFLSSATNLLAGVTDVNSGNDLFLSDRMAGTLTLISHTALDPDTTADHFTLDAALSDDGRYVAFRSVATDLVSGQVDEYGTADIFLWSRELGSTSLISHEAGFPLVATGLCWDVPDLSADGARLVFVSSAPNLVPGQTDDTFGLDDVFLYDRTAGATTLVSHTSASSSTATGGVDSTVVISADGNWIAFDSSAANLVAGQTESAATVDVFLYSRATSTNILVSHASTSATTAAHGLSRLPVISADGSRVGYLSEADNLMTGQVDVTGSRDVFLYDRASNGSVLVSRTSASPTSAGNGHADELSLSADGRYVAFSSSASNLVSADFNSRIDVFLYDRNTGVNVLTSRASSSPGTPSNGTSKAPRITADGSSVAFRSDGVDLVSGQVDATGSDDLFLWTRSSGTTSLVSHAAGSPTASGQKTSGGSFAISADGAWVALASLSESLASGVDDLNGFDDLFLYQRAGGQNSLITLRGGTVSASAGGGLGGSTATSISNDGRYVAFTSAASNVVPGTADSNNASDVFLYDRLTGTITLVSHAASSPTTAGDAASRQPLVSSDGSVVLFESSASNLAPSQTAGAARQLYLWDRNLGQVTLVTHSSASPSVPGDGILWGLGYYDVSGDGRWIVFNDSATNLVAGQSESNGGGDIFLYDRILGTTTLISHASSSPTQTGSSFSGALAVSDDGRTIAFQSGASDLVPGQSGSGGLFVHDRIAGTTLRASPSADSSYLAINADGQRVVFASNASNLVTGQVDTNGSQDLFLWDRATASIRLVSHGPGSATTTGNNVSGFCTSSVSAPAISADGRWTAFCSNATDLIAGQGESNFGTDIFLFDGSSGTVTLVSHAVYPATQVGNHPSDEAALSADGRFLAFLSWASNLVPNQVDQNPSYDLFLYDREAGSTTLVSHIPSSEITTSVQWINPGEGVPRLSADGAWLAFQSPSPDLVSGDHDGAIDVFLHANPLPGRDFFTIPPCRVLDTREQTPALSSGLKRTVAVAGSCGIPVTARAVALNVTVIQPTGPGRLTLHPGDLAASSTSTVNFSAGITRANSATMTLALDGTGTLALTAVVNGGGTVDAIVDVSGYFE